MSVFGSARRNARHASAPSLPSPGGDAPATTHLGSTPSRLGAIVAVLASLLRTKPFLTYFIDLADAQFPTKKRRSGVRKLRRESPRLYWFCIVFDAAFIAAVVAAVVAMTLAAAYCVVTGLSAGPGSVGRALRCLTVGAMYCTG
jgi:hypothetical protein